MIGHGLLGKVLAGLPADDAAQVRDTCARWARLRFAAGATAYPQAGRKSLPVLRGTLVHVTVERLPDGRDPHRAMWLWHAAPARCPWTSSGAPTSPGSTSSTRSAPSRAFPASPPRR